MAKTALKSAPPPPKEPEAQLADAAKPQKAKKKGSGKLLVIGLVLLILIGAAVSWFFTGREAPGEKAAPAAADKPPTFINLETFTVNLQPEVGDQYLQVTLAVKATDDAVSEQMKLHMPEIRNRLLLLLSSKSPSALLTTEGKVQLAADILGEVKKPLPEALREHVGAVYFTSFVIQ